MYSLPSSALKVNCWKIISEILQTQMPLVQVTRDTTANDVRNQIQRGHEVTLQSFYDVFRWGVVKYSGNRWSINTEMVQILIDAGGTITAQEFVQWSGRPSPTLEVNLAILEVFVRARALLDINYTQLLRIASKGHNVELVKLLIEQEVDLVTFFELDLDRQARRSRYPPPLFGKNRYS